MTAPLSRTFLNRHVKAIAQRSLLLKLWRADQAPIAKV